MCQLRSPSGSGHGAVVSAKEAALRFVEHSKAQAAAFAHTHIKALENVSVLPVHTRCPT